MTPFALSPSDANAFLNEVDTHGQLGRLPDWGGIVQWRGRFVLVFKKVDGSYALSDITGGIPDSSVPGGMIPVEALVANTPTTQIGQVEAFLYSLPSNFMDIAKERAIQIAQGAADIAEPLLPAFGIVAVLAIATLIFIYAPRPRSN